MHTHIVSVRRHVAAPAAEVYAVLADYRDRHARILPRYFGPLRVESGGTGAGTVVSFTMKAGGRRRFFRMRVDEPRPGRELRETDLSTGVATTFVVEPAGAGTLVEIRTELPQRRGTLDAVRVWLTARFLRHVYREEIDLLGRLLAR